MHYDFDTPVNRLWTDCIKFDRPEKRGRTADLLSFWVADMDFKTAPQIIDAIQSRAAHGIFGYTEPGTAYFEALNSWCSSRYGLDVAEEQVTVTPGVVYALATAIRAFTEPGDAVVIQQPVYYPFQGEVQANKRALAVSQLVLDGDRYVIDFDEFERSVTETGAKLFILCNPHNPVGRAWTEAELRRLGEICLEHDVLVVSDEIHMDFARPGHTHTAFATLGPEFAARCITCTSASKTFNLAGLQVANVIIADPTLRRHFRAEVEATGYSQPNTLGMVATQAAYEHGGPWLDELKGYLEGNWTLLGDALRAQAPELHLIQAESTYLAWIDCRSLGLSASELERFVEDEAKLWLDCGHIFGKGGVGFIRINLATQKAYLTRALDQLGAAVARKCSGCV